MLMSNVLNGIQEPLNNVGPMRRGQNFSKRQGDYTYIHACDIVSGNIRIILAVAIPRYVPSGRRMISYCFKANKNSNDTSAKQLSEKRRILAARVYSANGNSGP